MEVSLEGVSAEEIAGLATLAKRLGSNPKTRKDFMRLVKSDNPALSIPEVDLPDEIMAKIAEDAKERQKLEARLLESEQREEIRARREAIKRAKGLNDSQIEEVEKMMVEKGIHNHETAADFFLSQQKMAEPTPSFEPAKRLEIPALDKIKSNQSPIDMYKTAMHTAIDDLKSGRL